MYLRRGAPEGETTVNTLRTDARVESKKANATQQLGPIDSTAQVQQTSASNGNARPSTARPTSGCHRAHKHVVEADVREQTATSRVVALIRRHLQREWESGAVFIWWCLRGTAAQSGRVDEGGSDDVAAKSACTSSGVVEGVPSDRHLRAALKGSASRVKGGNMRQEGHDLPTVLTGKTLGVLHHYFPVRDAGAERHLLMITPALPVAPPVDDVSCQ
jgi:hypothetical protein